MSKEEQFNSIFRENYPRVFRLCKGYFNGDEVHAADAAQEVFIKVWQHLHQFREESALSTWIYRITVNTCLLQLRKPSRKKEINTADLPEQIAEGPPSEEESRLKKMYACIGKLDETGKMIILMVLEGVEYTDIAGVIGVSEDTLRVRIHRIKKSLSNCVR